MKRFNWDKWLAVAVALLVLPADAHSQDVGVTTFGAGHKVVLHSRMKLSQQQKKAHRDFRAKAGYFGAVAFHKAGSIHFWVRNMHSLSTARQFAMGGCEELARQLNEDPKLCVLYASVIPRDLSPYEHGAMGLSETGLKALTGDYRKKQEPGRFGAFAISGMADWGYTSGRRNEADAVGSAIASCEAAADREISGWSNEVRGRINRYKLNTCKIIHVTRP